MQQLLKNHFGYDEFRPLQAEIIESVLAGQDSFVLMPTGGGKSLCYQLPALKFPGLTLVVSPLIALMKDQVDALQANGIDADFINSSLDHRQIAAVMERIRQKQVKLLYLAPERFALPRFQQFLEEQKLSLIAVDEAHCISEWGHDFRPDYRNLHVLKRKFPGVPVIALTATATPRVRQDILQHLNIVEARQFISSFDRANLRLSVVEKRQAFPKLVSLLQDYKSESVIIYCFSRNDTEEIADNLRLNGFKARAYHAGLPPLERRQAQEAFVKDQCDIIVATIAFGMGIDKPDVRLVVHYTFPRSLEAYYQEIGRAGRDGLPSECVLFYTYADLRKHEFFIDRMEDRRQQERSREQLDQVLAYCELSSCRRQYLLSYFGEDLPSDNCGACDSCQNKQEKIDATKIAQKIMSAILRTDSRFGRNYIIDVLKGRQTQKIKQNRHEQLKVFGQASSFSEDEIGQFIKQLLDLNYLQKSPGQYPVLSLGKKGKQALNDGAQIMLQAPVMELKKEISGVDDLDYNQELFQILKDRRRQLAEEKQVPPFVIFGDRSLQEMAYYLPTDQPAFSRISGVGAVKLKNYADTFLDLIRDFCRAHGLVAPARPAADIPSIEVKTKTKRRYHQKTKELLAKKIPIDRIAKHQDLKPSTIINHIEKLLDAGEKPDLEYLRLPQKRFEDISHAFSACGDEFLRPVFDYLEGRYSYDEIRLVRLLLRS